MNIGQPSRGGACWWCTVGDPAREFRDIRLLAVTIVLRGRLDHAPFAQMFQHLSKWSMHSEHTRLSCSRISAERGATVLRVCHCQNAVKLKCEKWYIYNLSQI